MKKLLVPIDYSDCAINALNYASNLAKELGAEVDVLHAFRLPSAGGTPVIWDLEESLKTERELEMTEVLDDFTAKYPEVNYTGAVIHGLTSHIVLELLENTEYDMVVMGTTGASGIKEVFLGSTTASLIDKMTTPLFVVPESSSYEGIDSFVLASDLDRIIAHDKIEVVKDLASSYKACIKVLSIKEKVDHFEYEKDIRSLEVLIELENELGEYGYTTEIVQKENLADMEKAIFEHSDAPKSVLVLIHRKRSLFKRIFGHSFSKKFAMHATSPLLVLQD